MLLFIGIVIIILIIFIIILCIALFSDDSNSQKLYEKPERLAGKKGEIEATNIICSVLRNNDRLFTNVRIQYQDKPAELDNVIVNSFGVFIIEVKNYNGSIYGNEEDYEWVKYHTSKAGKTYSKIVRNPIKQVKRQIYVLKNFISYYSHVQVWIKGYALLLKQNSPVNSAYILSSAEDIDKAIHTPTRNRLTKQDIEEISKLLSEFAK